jgi:hypothetical protein
MHACNQTVRVKPNGCSILKVKPKLKYFSFTDFGSSRYVLLVRYIARLIFDDIVHLITLTGTKPYGCYALSSSISFPTMSTHMPSSTTSYGITPWKPARHTCPRPWWRRLAWADPPSLQPGRSPGLGDGGTPSIMWCSIAFCLKKWHGRHVFPGF